MSGNPVRFTLLSHPLPQGRAMAFMDALDEAVTPQASAASMNETDEAAGLWQVTAYYAELPQKADLEQLVAGLDLSLDAVTITELPDTDWVAQSLDGLKSVIAGRFYVHGGHESCPRAGGISLQIDAGTAFGTGHHGTTRGCLLALDDLLKVRQPKRTLDIGCGTGVLAIAAACAARSRVVASDIDPEAHKVTEMNAALNQAKVTVRTAAGTHDQAIAAAAPYDLIFANILARPLIALAPDIIQLAAPQGDIVLSGLTVNQESRVFAAYQSRGAVLVRRIRLENWSTLWLRAALG